MAAYLAERTERSVCSWCLEVQDSGNQIQTCGWKSIMPFRGMKDPHTLYCSCLEEDWRKNSRIEWHMDCNISVSSSRLVSMFCFEILTSLVASVPALVCLQPIDHPHLFPIYATYLPLLFPVSPQSLLYLVWTLLSGILLMLLSMVCDFALPFGFWIFACCPPVIVGLLRTDFLCITTCFLSKDSAFLNFTSAAVSFSAPQSQFNPELLHRWIDSYK